jgi:hypothetical protein
MAPASTVTASEVLTPVTACVLLIAMLVINRVREDAFGKTDTAEPGILQVIRSFRPLRVAFLFLLSTAFSAQAIRPELPFRPPETPAERALDAVLHRANVDPNPLSNLLGGRGEPNFRQTVDYSRFLTPALVAAIAQVERSLVRQNCGGRYRSGEVCGLDFVPLTCAQDSSETYLYRTQATRPGEAIITYRWTGSDRRTVATYRLLYRKGSWRLDGIRCAEGGREFNPVGLTPARR